MGVSCDSWSNLGIHDASIRYTAMRIMMIATECLSLATNGPLTRYAKLQVAHAPGMPGTFSPAADFEGNRYLAIPACITARAWRTCCDACRDRLPAVTGKTFPAFPAHAHPQFCVSGKRPMSGWLWMVRRCTPCPSSSTGSTGHRWKPPEDLKIQTGDPGIQTGVISCCWT